MKRTILATYFVFHVLLCMACTAQAVQERLKQEEQEIEELGDNVELATFGGGCFWCTEAVFEEVEGVKTVKSGYAGGAIDNPTYKQICTGTTGHAEVIQIAFDPDVVPFEKLVEIHMKTHDPTTLNRQGADVGSQYRSVIFFHNEKQQAAANEIIKQLNAAGVYPDPIVTEIAEFTKMYPAEDYHQNYYAQNPNQGYCRAVIQPKMSKFRKVFADILKKE